MINRYENHHYLHTGQEGVFDKLENRYLTQAEVNQLQLEYNGHLDEIYKLIK